MMRRLLTFSVLFLFALCAFSQNTFEEEYRKFKDAATAGYDDFRRKANEEYAAFMAQAWKEYQVMPAVKLPKEFDLPPVIFGQDEGRERDNKEQPYEDLVEHDKSSTPQPKPLTPIREDDSDCETHSLRFYGTAICIRLPRHFSLTVKVSDANSAARAWQQLAALGMNNTIRDCLEARIRFQLCDWAYFEMLQQLAADVCGQTNEATLLHAFLYCQSGYKMRLAMTSSGKLILLFNSKNYFFDLAGLSLTDGIFYTAEQVNTDESISVFDQAFPNEMPMTMDISQTPHFDADYSEPRTIRATDCSVRVQCRVNKNLIAFFNSYPTSYIDDNFMTRWRYYADTPLDPTVQETLYKGLRESLKADSTELGRANLLLNFVQTGFVYEYDDKVWGCDRAFFAEETLFYPYCDCEDRGILFSRLVRDLLGLKVVLVYYPGHLATAVCFSDGAHGDYININGKPFTICDPTFIHAPVGYTMTGMDNSKATVILLH